MDNKRPVVSDVLQEQSTLESATPVANNGFVNQYAAQNGVYTTESLEVNDGSGVKTTKAEPVSYSASDLRLNFSKRKALVASLVITLLVASLFLSTISFLFHKADDSQKAQQVSTQQDVSLSGADDTKLPPELQGANESLLISGDLISRGNIKIVNNGVVTTLKSSGIGGNQILTLPGASGTLCLDTNNCGYASVGQLAGLQTYVGQLVIPSAGVDNLNSQKGTVSIQGSINQIAVNTTNGVITISTPQDLDANANVQFNNLTLGNTGQITANKLIQTASGNNVSVDAGTDNIILTANGRTFQLPNVGPSSQTICTTGATCASGSGAAVILAPTSVQNDATADDSIFINDTAGGALIHLQTNSVDKLVVANNGDTTVGGSLNAINFVGNGASLTSLNGSNISSGTVANARLVNGGALTVTAGNGLINGGSVSLGGTTTLNIGAGDGITVNTNDIAVDGTVCRTSGNCAGSGSGVTANTPGVANRLAVFTTAQDITSSWLFQNSSTLELDNTRNLSLLGGNINANGTITGTQLISTVSTGTAPLTVASATLVTNFNADLLDGQTGSFYQDASNLTAGTVASARIFGAYNGLTGSTALATVGTITAGTWNGTAIADGFLQDNITVSNLGTVDWTALSNYPAVCAAGSAVSALADVPTCTAFATGTTASYIQNQSGSDQTADFRISGTGRANTSLIAPVVDSISGTLTIGNTNATAINIGKTTSNIQTAITGTTLIKPSTGNDSTVALAVQNAAGTANVLTVDTINFTTNLRAGSDSKTLGSELYPTNNFSADWTNTGWNVSPNTQATHNSGNTNSLTNTTVSISAGAVYQVQFTLSGTCGTGNLVVTLGGTTLATLNGTTNCGNVNNGVYSYLVTASNTNKLAFAPASTWTGTINTVSIKQVTGGYTAALVVKNASGTANIEIRASNSTDNTFIGLSSGRFNTSGIQNTALGSNALALNTTGFANTALGTGTLQVNTTGYGNDAIGINALASNTTGYGNDAMGYGALLNNTTGVYNTALGNIALQANTTGYQNVAVGAASLQLNTTGYSNVAVGFGSLTSNTTGYTNTAIGAGSLYSTTTGYNNVASGFNSLYTTTTGNNNIATGAAALYGNTTGSYNIATGTNSLYTNTTGHDNVAIGTAALYSNTTGNLNIATGTNSLYTNTTGHDNVATGTNTLSGNTTGYNNVATGTNSLIANTTGYNNVASGVNSLAGNTTGGGNTSSGVAALQSNTTGDLNTAMGFAAGAAYTTGTSNTAIGDRAGFQDALGLFNTSGALQRSTAIGALAQVQASDSIVLGSVDNATKVGIGTTVPLNTFSVEPLDYQTGTATRTNGSATLVGTGTTWTTAMAGDQIVFADGTTNTVLSRTDNTHITMGTSYGGTTDASPVAYRFHKTGLQVASNGNVGIGTTVPNYKLHVVGAAYFDGNLTVTNGGYLALGFSSDYTTTGIQNDVNLGTASSVRYNGSGSATFTGITGGTDGRILYLHNASAYSLMLSHQSTSSTAANRIITGTNSDLYLAPDSSITMQYDATSSRWRVIGQNGVTAINGDTARMTRAAAQSIGASTIPAVVKVAFDTENFDVGGIADSATNDRFTVARSGKYLVTGHVSIASLATTTRVAAVIYVNGAAQVTTITPYAGGGGGSITAEVTQVLDLTAGDYVEFYVGHDDSVSRNTSTGSSAATMSVSQIDTPSASTSSSTGSAFSVHKNGTNQTVTTGVDTKLTWSTEVFDTNNNFDLATNRFTPTIPGKYLITANAGCTTNSNGQCVVSLYKNGSLLTRSSATSQTAIVNTTMVVDMNGTTDYVEAYVRDDAGTLIRGNATDTNFSASLLSALGNTSGGGWTDDGSSVRLNDPTDKVGIGTSTPGYKLHVVDATTATSGTDNVLSKTTLTVSPGSVPGSLTEWYASMAAVTTTSTNLTSNSYLHGFVGSVTNAGSGAISAGQQTGITGAVYNTSNGSIDTAYGVMGNIQNTGSGSITDATAIRASAPNAGGGTIQNAYGVYIQSQKATGVTNGYGLWQNGANDLNYFAGNVGIGIAPSASFTLRANNSIMGAASGTGEAFRIGDDSVLCDINIGNTAALRGVQGGGCGTAGTGTLRVTIAADSSLRYKENVSDANYGLGSILQMHPVKFDYKDGGRKNNIGLIAEDLAGIIPEAVQYDELGRPDAIYYDELTPVLIKGIQELNSKIDAVQAGVVNVNNLTVNTLHVTGDAVIEGKLTVGSIEVGNITVNGHIITSGDTPQIAVGAGAGQADTGNNIAAPTVQIVGNDTSGTITIKAGANGLADELVKLTFNKPFSGKPRVVLAAANRGAAGLRAFYDAENTSTDSFSILSDVAPQAGKTYSFTYYIVQ